MRAPTGDPPSRPSDILRASNRQLAADIQSDQNVSSIWNRISSKVGNGYKKSVGLLHTMFRSSLGDEVLDNADYSSPAFSLANDKNDHCCIIPEMIWISDNSDSEESDDDGDRDDDEDLSMGDEDLSMGDGRVTSDKYFHNVRALPHLLYNDFNNWVSVCVLSNCLFITILSFTNPSSFISPMRTSLQVFSTIGITRSESDVQTLKFTTFVT